MASEIIIAFVGVICTALSGAITFFFTKKKYNTEVDSQQIQNISASFDTYKKMTDETISSLNQKIEMLQKENDSLRQQVSQLQLQLINFIGSQYTQDLKKE